MADKLLDFRSYLHAFGKPVSGDPGYEDIQRGESIDLLDIFQPDKKRRKQELIDGASEYAEAYKDYVKLANKQLLAPPKESAPASTQEAFGMMPGAAGAIPSLQAFSPQVLQQPMAVGQQPGLQYPPQQFQALMDALPPTWQTPIVGAPGMFPDRPLQAPEQSRLMELGKAELEGKVSLPGSSIQPSSVITKGMEIAQPKFETLAPGSTLTLTEGGVTKSLFTAPAKAEKSHVGKYIDDLTDARIDPKSPQGQALIRKYAINLASEKGTIINLGGGLSEAVTKILDEGRNAAEGALTTHDAVQRSLAAISKQAVTLGPAATIRNTADQVAQVMGIAGKDTTERLVNTRSVIRAFGQFSLAARKQLKGQGQVSDFEGKLITKAESGDIDSMTLPELSSFLEVTDRLAKRQYDAYQKNLGALAKKKDYAEVVPFFEVGTWAETPGVVAPFNDAAKEKRYQAWKAQHQ